MNLLWTISLILVHRESFSDTAEPDITLLSRVTKDNKMNMTCVAGSNVRGRALTFITHLGGIYQNFPKQVSIYTSKEGFVYPRDTYDCDFTSSCSSEWHEKVKPATLGFHDLAPVTDERWENFPIYYSKQHNTITHTFEKNSQSVGLSVRTSGNVSMTFCYSVWKEYKYEDVCYWILLNNNNAKIITLWLCTNQTVEDPTTNSYCTTLTSGADINYNKSFWTHFKLTITNSSILKVENQGSTFLNFKTSDNLEGIKQISLKNSKWAIWKIHGYNYLSVQEKKDPNAWRPIGPALQADDTGFVCVELYAATCATCTFRFRLEQSSGSKEIRRNSSQNLQHWELIRLEMNSSRGKDYKLQVQVSGGAEGFWLIDNVRRCHEQETRTISLTLPINEHNTISCQALNHPDKWSSVQEGNINQIKNLEVCSDETVTGSKCSVSCLSALGTDCNNVIVCEPSASRTNPKCFCAAGYTGDQCQHKPIAPPISNMSWVNDKARITWTSSQKYNIKFKISIKLISTMLVSNPYFNKLYMIPKQANDHYSFDVPDDMPLSSTYQVGSSVVVSSPAVTPRFTGHVTCGARTNTTQDITIPAAHPDTITTQSFFHVLICNVTSEKNPQEILHSKLHSWSKCIGSSWIAANFTATNSSTHFIVGDPIKQPTNKPLTPDSYTINVIFVHEYKGDEKYVISTTTILTLISMETNSNPALYALLLLLFIPAIIVFMVWKKIYSKRAVPYQEVPTTANNIELISTQDKLLTNENDVTLIPTNKEANLQKKNAVNNIPIDNNHSKVVLVNNYLNYVEESLRNSELENQFELLPKGNCKPNNIGTSKENAAKNRYKGLSAYDHSRVILEKIPGDEFSDFINANYIDGYKHQKAYIATQGPKESTLSDFWRMIWQEKIECIVMLTNLIEEGKVKCEKYWPDIIGETVSYGVIYVTLLEIDTYVDFEYRIFNVKKCDASRKVQQYHFTSWPDHGIPLYPQALVPFLDKLNAVSPAKAPIVVHCSAGVGRTGTIILADICLRMAAAEKKIDVFKYYYIMRNNRCNMVASYDQYEFVHLVLVEYLFPSRNSIPCIELSKTVDQLIRERTTEEQMKYLENTAWQTQGSSGVVEVNEDLTSKSKNRFLDIVPNRRRIYLSKSGSSSSDYINAVRVDGYRNKDQFIVTQNPLPSTIKDFWQMVSEFKVKVIVSLNEITKNNEFWPYDKKEMSVSSNLTVKFISIIDESFYSICKLHLINSRNSDDDAIRSITIARFKNWKYKYITPSDVKEIIDFVEITRKQDSPIVVTCFDGARASGLYVALSFVLAKIKLEKVCDVCLAVRIIRRNRDQFVNDIKQFEFLYKAAVKYQSSFLTLKNNS